MYETEAQARANADAFPRRRWRGIAAVDIPIGDVRFRVLKSLGPGHYTIYGTPGDVWACVVTQGPL